MNKRQRDLFTIPVPHIRKPESSLVLTPDAFRGTFESPDEELYVTCKRCGASHTCKRTEAKAWCDDHYRVHHAWTGSPAVFDLNHVIQ